MITLEGYEIEEMRSINHIMTVELQFDKPVTQKEARDYLSRVLAKANELEMQAEKEKDFKKLAEKNAEEQKIIAVPQDEEMREYLSKADERLNEMSFAFPQEEETANESLEIADENHEIANDEAFDAEVRAEFQKAKKPEKTKGVLKVPVTEEEIAGMKQKRQEQATKAKEPKKIDWDKACALKKAGWSNKQIADELHANEGTINASIYKNLAKYNAGERKGKCEETEV